MSDLKIDGQVIKSEFFHSNELGWYAMLQIQLRDEDFFIAQQLPQKVTCGWERWIPVTERLPEERAFLLICTVDKNVGEAVFDYDRQFYWMNTDEYDVPLSVTHWMPLPEPPKE